MNRDFDQLFQAVSVEQLRKAIESNPDVNEVHPVLLQSTQNGFRLYP